MPKNSENDWQKKEERHCTKTLSLHKHAVQSVAYGVCHQW